MCDMENDLYEVPLHGVQSTYEVLCTEQDRETRWEKCNGFGVSSIYEVLLQSTLSITRSCHPYSALTPHLKLLTHGPNGHAIFNNVIQEACIGRSKEHYNPGSCILSNNHSRLSLISGIVDHIFLGSVVNFIPTNMLQSKSGAI